jgi:long-subunit fatty acid transport protein
MRKILTIISATFITGCLFAGGLVTNTNQSASWVRMPSRNASTEIDAVYYNPAGLMKLDNGFHFSLNNQTVFQTLTVESTYPYLNQSTYKGTVKAPFFPSIYAAYKFDKLAFSFGFMPVGGGGGAIYEDGLPSFEMGQSDLVPALAAKMGATAYKMDVYFEGTSIFFGFQGGVSYKINDWLSVAAGARYVTAKNTYEGYLRDIQVNTAAGWTDASAIMTGIAGQATTAATSTSAIITAVPAAAGLTLLQAEAATIITTAQRQALEGALTGFGSPTTVTIGQADAVFKGAARGYSNKATILSDQEANAEQTGSGITPFFSVNVSLLEKLSIAIKYEMATKLDLTNKTAKDLTTGFLNEDPTKPITKFPDGEKTRSDMPAMLSVGAELKLSKIKVTAGGNYFFDKSADYGHYIDPTPQNSTDYSVHINNSEIISNNGMSVQAGAEISLTEKFLVSAGYVYANKGVNSLYQSDLNYDLATHTFGAGGAYSITDKIKINIGASYTKYMQDSKDVNHFLGSINMLPTETYKKTALLFGLGLDLSF